LSDTSVFSKVLAGVTHGNGTSVAVLARLGFEPVADFR
jgi:hypothetical protein